MKKYRVALVQMRCGFLDTQGNLNKALAHVKKAAMSGAKLICLPEGFYTGYSNDELREAVELSEPQNGPLVSLFRDAARRFSVFLLLPFFERIGNDVRNTAVLIDDEGNIAGKYSKVQLIEAENGLLIPGDDFPVWDTKIGKISCAICYDLCFPEIIRKEVLAGAELILVPAAWRDRSYFSRWWDLNIACRALDNLVYIAAVNQVGSHGNTVFAGKSKVCCPTGVVLEEAGKDKEEVIFAEIDLAAVARDRSENTVLSDIRDDLYYL